MAMSRADQKVDVIYVTPEQEVFYTPDGVGRIYLDTVNEAKEETGITKVIYLMEAPDEY